MKHGKAARILWTAAALVLAFVLTACSGGSKVRADQELEGKYIAVMGEMFGVALTGEELDGFSFELESGGKGKVVIDGDSHSIKWKNDDETVTITVDKEDMTAQRGKDSFVMKDMLGMGMDLTFAKEGTAAADPAQYLPEEEKKLLGDWQSVSVTDILGDPIDPSEMAPDALALSFRGDHTGDASVEGKSFTGMKWSLLGSFGSFDTEDVKISWEPEDDGISVDYVNADGTYYTFFCTKGGVPSAGAKAAAPASPATQAAQAEKETKAAAETEAKQETKAETQEAGTSKTVTATGDYAPYWCTDWYGWWQMESCDGEYESLEGQWWDTCATIYVYDDDTGRVVLWDEDGSSSEEFCVCDVSFGPGTTSAGCMKSESGTFWGDCEIGHADWLVDPGASEVSDFDHMIAIEGRYEDETGGFLYYIYLRPWGMDWEDVREYDESLLPGFYDNWYVGKMNGFMPKKIGE